MKEVEDIKLPALAVKQLLAEIAIFAVLMSYKVAAAPWLMVMLGISVALTVLPSMSRGTAMMMVAAVPIAAYLLVTVGHVHIADFRGFGVDSAHDVSDYDR